MKSIVIALMMIFLMGCEAPASTIVLPEPTGYVVDTVGLLQSEQKGNLEDLAKSVDPVAQIAVCIVKTTGNMSIEEYGIKLAEKWKPGYKGKDNGIILILAKDDRHVRIEVGRGLEGKINDAQAGRILDSVVVPKFKQGEWFAGIYMGVAEIKKKIEG